MNKPPNIVAFKVPAQMYHQALNVLAELPYKQVGDLMMQLRAVQPIHEHIVDDPDNPPDDPDDPPGDTPDGPPTTH